MDKEWMSKHRLSREYEDGVESFLQFALQNCLDSNQIPCPCAKCGNLKRKNVITVSALFQGLERVSRGELAIVPCNVGNHWILTIIDPHKEMVSLVDPLSHRNRDSSWKEVVNKAMTMFNAKIGRRGKKQPNWEIIKAPIQPDNKQCGFFVMRYMREIIDELADNGSISLKSHFEHRRYSQEEIDEVRIEWANCVLEHI